MAVTGIAFAQTNVQHPVLAVSNPKAGNLLLVYACGNSDFTTPTDNGSNTGWTVAENATLGPYMYLWYRAATVYDQTNLTQVSVHGTVALSAKICAYQEVYEAQPTLVDHTSAAVVASPAATSPATRDLNLTGPAFVYAFSGNRGATTSTPIASGGSWSNNAANNTPGSWGIQGTDAEISGFVGWWWTNGAANYGTQITGWTNSQTDRNIILVAFPAAAPALVWAGGRGSTSSTVTVRWNFDLFPAQPPPNSLLVAYVQAPTATAALTAPSGWALQQQSFTSGVAAIYTKTSITSEPDVVFSCNSGEITAAVYTLVNAGNAGVATGIETVGMNFTTIPPATAATAPSLTAAGSGDLSLVAFQGENVAPGALPSGYYGGNNWAAGGFPTVIAGQVMARTLAAFGPTGAVTTTCSGTGTMVGFHALVFGASGGTPPGGGGITAAVAVGPFTVTAGGTVSGTGTGGGTVTGSAVLNLGPVTVAAGSTLETITATAAVFLGPVSVFAVSGLFGPGRHPVPGFRGRWRLTLHTRTFAPATLASTIIAELGDARARQLVQAWNTPAVLSFTLDGHSQSAALILELQQDVVGWRWDDQTGLEQPVFRGVIAQSQDTIDAQSHTVVYTCHDYTALLQRRILTSTYTVVGRDQDQIVSDLLTSASAMRTSNGTPLSPASYLPLSLFTANPDSSLRGLSGALRNRTYYGNQNVGTAVDDLAKVVGGFDYDVQPSSTDRTDSLRIFYPQQGVTRTDGIALQYGSTVAAATRTVDSSQYANYIRALGNNSSAAPTPQFFSEAWTPDAHAVTPVPVGLWMLDDNSGASDTVQSSLDERVAGDLNLDALLVPSYTLAMAPDAYTWGNPNMGDTVPLIIQSGRLNVNTSVRVLGITYNIGDDGQEDVTLVVSRPAQELYKFFLKADLDTKSLARR